MKKILILILAQISLFSLYSQEREINFEFNINEMECEEQPMCSEFDFNISFNTLKSLERITIFVRTDENEFEKTYQYGCEGADCYLRSIEGEEEFFFYRYSINIKTQFNVLQENVREILIQEWWKK